MTEAVFPVAIVMAAAAAYLEVDHGRLDITRAQALHAFARAVSDHSAATEITLSIEDFRLIADFWPSGE